MARTGWFNRNKTGYSVKHESHRHSLAAKGIKTALPKGSKCVTICAGTSTPNFDMVKKGKMLEWKKNLIAVADNPDYIEEQWVAIKKELGRERPETSYLRQKMKLMLEWTDEIDLADHQARMKKQKTDMVAKGYDMSHNDLGYAFFRGATSGNASNLKIVDKPDKTQLVGYEWAVYGERDKKTGKVTYYKGWDKYSPSTSAQLTKTGLRSRADIVVDKRKEVGYDMVSLSAIKDKIQKYQEKRKKLKEKHEAQAEKQLQQELELARQELKVKQAQAKTDVLKTKHLEAVARQRRELARIKAELEKGTPKGKAKKLAKKIGKEGLHLAGVLAKGVAKEVKLAVSTEEPKKRKK
ncbi:hypothetical protein DRN76_00005 [Methanosarcinales archaeon]|nr:MAG: hypothetical protein DRN76_00005 [Methanosarcinales archaeon]